MAEIIIIEGRSGTGKSTSLRNIDPVKRKAVLIVPNLKPLTFGGGEKKWEKFKKFTDEFNMVPVMIDKFVEKGAKLIIIEDFSHMFATRIMSDSFLAQGTGNSGFERWKFLARDVMHAIFFKASQLPKDIKIILLHHVERDESGYQKFKIFGKLLADPLDPVSYVSIVLHSLILDDKPIEERYVFQTQQDSLREAKSPMGMFPDMFIPNDLDAVLTLIEQYDEGEAVPAAESEQAAA